jgi:hypothetical protein
MLQLQLEFAQVLDITHISDGCESAVVLNCEMHIIVVANKLPVHVSLQLSSLASSCFLFKHNE